MTTEQLTAGLTALTARVNAVDGVNLQNSSTSRLGELDLEIAGLRTTIRQVTLVLEATLKDLAAQVANLQALSNRTLGAS